MHGNRIDATSRPPSLGMSKRDNSIWFNHVQYLKALGLARIPLPTYPLSRWRKVSNVVVFDIISDLGLVVLPLGDDAQDFDEHTLVSFVISWIRPEMHVSISQIVDECFDQHYIYSMIELIKVLEYKTIWLLNSVTNSLGNQSTTVQIFIKDNTFLWVPFLNNQSTKILKSSIPYKSIKSWMQFWRKLSTILENQVLSVTLLLSSAQEHGH